MRTNFTRTNYVVISLHDYFHFRYGSPGFIISDQGKEFVNSTNKELLILRIRLYLLIIHKQMV